MTRHDSNIPLVIGLIFAVTLHVAAAAGYTLYHDQSPLTRSKPQPPKPREEKPKPKPERAPKADPNAPAPDLAALSIDVDKPRVAGQPTSLRARLTNLGAPVTEPIDITLQINDRQPLTTTLTQSLDPGQVIDLTREIKVDEPGEHTITLSLDPAEKITDSDRSNNTITRTFTFKDPDRDTLALGQTDPSKVKINWISHKAFEELIAKRAEFDQAAVQRTTQPDPRADQAPLDPTPPMPRPSPNQPAPIAAAQPNPDPVAPEKMTKPTKTPDQPTRPNPSEQPENLAAGLAPRDPAPPIENTTPNPTESSEPTEAMARQPDQADTPEPVTDDTPAEKPVAAPQEKAQPDREVAMAKIPLPDLPELNPDLPDPVENPNTDKPEKKAPPIDPAKKPDPTDASKSVEAEKLPDVAPPTPKGQDRPMTKPADNPAEKKPEKTDGTQPKPPVQPTPKSPQQQAPSKLQPAMKPRPTAAPKDEREAPPVSRIEGLTVQPGKVVARHGLQINTVQPRFSVVAQRSALPANPTVELTFDDQGEVIHARFVRSTGYDNIDGPILASLYKWTAVGESLARIEDTFTVEIRILLVPEKLQGDDENDENPDEDNDN